jgi:hypothetical protein
MSRENVVFSPLEPFNHRNAISAFEIFSHLIFRANEQLTTEILNKRGSQAKAKMLSQSWQTTGKGLSNRGDATLCSHR